MPACLGFVVGKQMRAFLFIEATRNGVGTLAFRRQLIYFQDGLCLLRDGSPAVTFRT